MLRVCTALSLVAAFSFLTGCGTSNSNCDLSDVGEGQLLGSIDGSDWAISGVSYMWSGSSLMVNAPTASDYWMSAVLQKDNNGASIEDSLADNSTLQVTLDSTGSTGWVTLYPQSGSSYTTKSGGGTFSVTFNADDTLSGCFSVDAASDDSTIQASGQFIALPSSL